MQDLAVGVSSHFSSTQELVEVAVVVVLVVEQESEVKFEIVLKLNFMEQAPYYS